MNNIFKHEASVDSVDSEIIWSLLLKMGDTKHLKKVIESIYRQLAASVQMYVHKLEQH